MTNYIFDLLNKIYNKVVVCPLTYILWKKGLVIVHCAKPHRQSTYELIIKIKKENKLLLSINEARQLFQVANQASKLDGDMAEVGVYMGASAKLISIASNNKSLHIFDTFEGLPELSKFDDYKQFYSTQFVASFDFVKHYLSSCSNVFIYRGFFPQTTGPIMEKKFCFVHLDVDIYESTKSCLEFFYPRMVKGGVIISHDYPNSVGVRKAFDEFFRNKKEVIVEFTERQCLVVKI